MIVDNQQEWMGYMVMMKEMVMTDCRSQVGLFACRVSLVVGSQCC